MTTLHLLSPEIEVRKVLIGLWLTPLIAQAKQEFAVRRNEWLGECVEVYLLGILTNTGVCETSTTDFSTFLSSQPFKAVHNDVFLSLCNEGDY